MNRFHLAHQLPHRLRYVIPKLKDALQGERLCDVIGQMESVTDVRANVQAHSLIITIEDETIRPDIEHLIQITDLAQLGEHCHIYCGIEHGDAQVSKTGMLSMAAVTAATPLLPNTLAAPLSIGANAPMLYSGLKELTGHGITSHVLESLAVAVSLWRRDYTAANITSLLLETGEYIEESTSDKSDALLRELIKPKVEEVWVDSNGEELKIGYDFLKVGDIVIIGTGDMIGIDGHIVEGEALVNQASMTGEGLSVKKEYGDRVIAGTVVEEGRIKVWAEHVGDDTSIARVTRYIEESLDSKSASALRASKLADKLVPITLGLSGFALAATGDWERVASVLQADYSCALKLATPVAFKSSLHKAGKHGIIMKNAQTLENLNEIDTIVFDKTGTLTTGELYVSDVISFDPEWSEDRILALSASAEEHYFHPVAEAVVRAAKEHSLEHIHHEEVEFIVAHGVTTEVENKKVHIGSRHFLEDDEGIDFNGHHPLIRQHRDEGKTLLFIGYDYQLLGMITLIDEVRHNAKTTIDHLHALGIQEVMMLTGDNHVKAHEVAETLGIDTVHAELLPTDKGDIVKELVASGKNVLFVGDGINDAPALVEATVGVSMHQGAEIAKASSDVALLVDDISYITDMITIARNTMHLIDTNYKITVGVNSAILAAATLGYIKPITTALFHNGTTVGILLNAIKGVSIQKQPHHHDRPSPSIMESTGPS